MAQKISLKVATFESGEKLIANDLVDLGLDGDVDHMKITFDNEKTLGYALCGGWFFSAVTVVFFPFWLIFFGCFRYCIKTWAESRTAAVTERQLVLKQGYFGCCCCCWNETTKSVPLDKITDLQVQQGCVQRCFDVREIRVETASATSEMPEMRLIGLNNPLEIRTKILKVRDGNSNVCSHYQSGTAGDDASYNPLLPQPQGASTEQLQAIIASQSETMIQIKDVLQDMRSALQSMDSKMSKESTLM